MNKTLLGFMRKEFLQTLRDVRMRGLIFVMPMLQMILFGLAISTEVKNVRLKTVYAPSDTIAERVEERCFASGWFIPANVTGDDMYGWIKSRQADAVLAVPEGGLTKAFHRGEGRMQLLVDATNAVRARGIESYMKSILAMVAAEENQRKNNVPAFSLDVRVLYNPSMESPIFMVPGVMCLILGILTVILTSMSMAREKEIGTFEMLVAAPIKNWEILAGKTIPYIILGMVDAFLVFFVAVFFFSVPMRGHIWQFFLAALVFVSTTVNIGMLISTFARNQQQAMMGGFLFVFPSVLLSGIMYPVDNMPAALKIIAYLDPLKYFVTLLRNIMLKGGDPEVLAFNIGVLALMATSCILLGFKRFKQTLN